LQDLRLLIRHRFATVASAVERRLGNPAKRLLAPPQQEISCRRSRDTTSNIRQT
jgi:hypothetical protein